MKNNSLFNFHAGHTNFRTLLNSTEFQDKLMLGTYPDLHFVTCVYRGEPCATKVDSNKSFFLFLIE